MAAKPFFAFKYFPVRCKEIVKQVETIRSWGQAFAIGGEFINPWKASGGSETARTFQDLPANELGPDNSWGGGRAPRLATEAMR